MIDRDLQLRHARHIISLDVFQETQFDAAHAGDPAGSEQAFHRRSSRPGRRGAPHRPGPSPHAVPGGALSRPGVARAPAHLAGDGRLGPEYDLGADRLGQHPASLAGRGGLPLDVLGSSLRASVLFEQDILSAMSSCFRPAQSRAKASRSRGVIRRRRVMRSARSSTRPPNPPLTHGKDLESTRGRRRRATRSRQQAPVPRQRFSRPAQRLHLGPVPRPASPGITLNHGRPVRRLWRLSHE